MQSGDGLTEKRTYLDIPGIRETLLELARTYREYGNAPGTFVNDNLQLSLPIPMWGEYGYGVDGTVTFAASTAESQTIHTTPNNERTWVTGIAAQRTTGDNRIDQIRMQQPEGYRAGTARATLIQLGAGLQFIYWPGMGSEQDVALAIPGPQLLEPGGIIQMRSDGNGVSSTNVFYEITMVRFKLYRARSPEEIGGA